MIWFLLLLAGSCLRFQRFGLLSCSLFRCFFQTEVQKIFMDVAASPDPAGMDPSAESEEGPGFYPRDGSEGNRSSGSHVINDDTSVLTTPDAVANAFVVDADAVSLPSTPPSEGGGGGGGVNNTRIAGAGSDSQTSLRLSSAASSSAARARALTRPTGKGPEKKGNSGDEREGTRGKAGRGRGPGGAEGEDSSHVHAGGEEVSRRRERAGGRPGEDDDETSTKGKERRKGEEGKGKGGGGGGLKLPTTKGGVGRLQYPGLKNQSANNNNNAAADVEDPTQQVPRKVILWAEMSDQVGGKKKAGATAFKFYNGTCVRSVTIFADVWVRFSHPSLFFPGFL